MRSIVTGGAGFIGSNLADTLAQNHDVVIIDNLATGRLENIEHLLDHPRVTFVEGSVTDLDLLMETFPGADGIFHQAAIPSVPRSVGSPSPLAGSTISCRTHTSPDGSVPVHDPWVDPATSPDAPPGLGVPVETLARPWVTFIKGRHHRPPDGDATGHRAGAV